MTVGELMHSVSKEAVLASLAMTYTGDGEDPDGYSRMWDQMLDMQPELTDVRCMLSHSEHGIDVSGIEEGSDVHMAIEFVPWAQWLSMPVVVDPKLGDMSPVEQLCHVFYEIAWGGYTEEDQRGTLDMIDERCDELKQMLENKKRDIS